MKISMLLNEMGTKEIDVLVADAKVSKSAKIVKLFEAGVECKEIALMLGIRYNFAYNVIFNYCNIKGVAKTGSSRTGTNGAKKEQIIKLFHAGSSKVEICKELQLNYNYVSKVCNEAPSPVIVSKIEVLAVESEVAEEKVVTKGKNKEAK